MPNGTFTGVDTSAEISEDFVDILIVNTSGFSGTIEIQRQVEGSDFEAMETITEADLPYNKVAEHGRSRATRAECTVHGGGTATWHIGGGKRF